MTSAEKQAKYNEKKKLNRTPVKRGPKPINGGIYLIILFIYKLSCYDK